MTRARLAVAAVAGGLLLGGCGQAPAPDAAGSGDAVTTRDVVRIEESPSSAASPPPASSKTKASRASKATPSLPPGDPGLDAPSAPDPGKPSADPHHAGARRAVPVAAMLTPDTVQMALGGSWTRKPGGGDECVRPDGHLAARAMSYGGSSGGLVAETVATYPDDAAADAAVKSLGRAAADCGWTDVSDPRLGSASVSAKDGGRSMVAVSTEGVVVVLVGSGRSTEQPGGWDSLVDLALGSSCPAAPDGCH